MPTTKRKPSSIKAEQGASRKKAKTGAAKATTTTDKKKRATTAKRNTNDDESSTIDHEVAISASEPLIPNNCMLPSYLADAFGDLYAQDGLLCLGKGLQWLMLMAAFCRFYGDDTEDGYAALIAEEEYTAKGRVAPPLKQIRRPLVFVLGLKDYDRTTLLDVLNSWGTPDYMLPVMITNESGQAKDRTTLYQQRGVICITSRILIVDLLMSVVSAHDIDGILVAHGHTVTEQSTEAFIIRIFQSQRLASSNFSSSSSRSGFVKAFSDCPDQLTSGFAKVDKILKSLHVTQLYLYPRFHDSIRGELEQPIAATPSVTEFHQPLTPLQKDIQNAIAAAVVKVLRQLRNSTEHLLVSTTLEGSSGKSSKNPWAEDTELSVENCVTNNFDRTVQRQLEPYWHRLSAQTKQLVQDLKTLRNLFQALLQYDCVNFYKFLCWIQSNSATSRQPAMWLLDPAADTIFRKAKQRVYTIYQRKCPPPTRVVAIGNDASTKNPPTVPALNPVLEENPKWKLLKKVLHEIEREHAEKKKSRPADADVGRGPVNILVMVKEERTLKGIKMYLTEGKNKTLLKRWLDYLELINDKSRSITDTKGGTGSISEESRLLLEEEGRVRRILFGDKGNFRSSTHVNSSNNPSGEGGGGGGGPSDTTGKKEKHRQLNQVPDYIRKRRRVASEKGRGQTTGQIEDLERQAVLDEAIERVEHDLDINLEDDDGAVDKNISNRDNGDSSDEDDEDALFRVTFPDEEMRVIIKTYTSIEGDQAYLFLQDLQPRYVVLYDAEVFFIRAVEIYSATSFRLNAGPRVQWDEDYHNRLRVFFLVFEASAEEKNFKKSLEREQMAFEKLIHHKQTMAPPMLHTGMTQEMHQAMEQGGVGGTYMNGTLPLAFDSTSTRHGRGKFNASKVRRDIAVDVREFRSALPSLLHQNGMRLAPVTLTVGDFVLTNVHCVERKSISDLFGSFASGRLYTQAEAMSKYYKCPCLLIEFDPNKSFSLQNSKDLGVEIKTDSICSKIALLTMHFNKLRILWSRSPHETCKIFSALKTNHDEVDVDRAVKYGHDEAEENLLVPDNKEGEEEDEINEVARDMLLRLPGVNVQSARRIMQEVDSLSELCELSRDELRRIAGPATGQKLFTFFRQKIAA